MFEILTGGLRPKFDYRDGQQSAQAVSKRKITNAGGNN
jgi:hypothetical protein